jgi:geranylgeranyl diphosphate synthase type I
MPTIQNYLVSERQKSSLLLEQFIDQEFSLFDTDLYARDFLAAIKHNVIAGGKYGRPLLAKLAYEITSGHPSSDDVALATLATELLHRFILVHDDIIDGDKNRHGQPTLETLFSQEDFIKSNQSPWWGSSMAIVAGDVVHSLVDQAILKTSLPHDIKQRVITGLHQCLINTALGWRLETKLKTQPLSQTTLADVEKAMMLVSGEYSVRWPLRIGQLLAGSQFSWNKSLEEYGLHIGLAFQLQDDILGIFGDAAQTGKPVGGDIREAKKTHLLMHAYKHASPKNRLLLESMLGKEVTIDQLAEVRQLFDATGSLEFAQQEIQQHLKLGLSAIDSLKQTEASEKLKALARFLCNRDH